MQLATVALWVTLVAQVDRRAVCDGVETIGDDRLALAQAAAATTPPHVPEARLDRVDAPDTVV